MAAAQGFVAPGYEAVKQAFEQHLQDGIEEHVQCCAYVSGIKVVDLWGTNQDNATNNTLSLGDKYGPESLQNIFSSTKAVTSLVVAMLEDRGHIRSHLLLFLIGRGSLFEWMVCGISLLAFRLHTIARKRSTTVSCRC